MPDATPVSLSKVERLAKDSFALGIASIICGVTALPAIIYSIRTLLLMRKETASKTARRKVIFSLLFSSSILTFVLFTFFSALGAAQALANQIRCVNNMKQLVLAVKVYASENSDTYPAAQWCDIISTNKSEWDNSSLDVSNAFRCSVASKKQRCSYAMNRQFVALKDTNQIAPNTVMLFESDAGWNAVGGPELAVKRHHSKIIIALADGSVEEIKPDDLKNLRWNPNTNSPSK